jgi:hypothetical protein
MMFKAVVVLALAAVAIGKSNTIYTLKLAL